MQKALSFALLLVLVLISKLAAAEMLFGYVIGISDGDTITLLEGSDLQHKIRIGGIDVPEKAQPFGERAKQNLTALALGKPAAVEWSRLDRHGRIIGKVTVDAHDLGLRQIEAGLVS